MYKSKKIVQKGILCVNHFFKNLIATHYNSNIKTDLPQKVPSQKSRGFQYICQILQITIKYL